MMKKLAIIMSIFLVIFSVSCINISKVYAESSDRLGHRVDGSDQVVADEEFNPNDWKPETGDVKNADNLKDFGNKIIGLIKIGGTIFSVVALVIMGIKYIVGSVEEKAEYKKTMVPYVIGAVLLFGITNLLGIVQGVVSQL